MNYQVTFEVSGATLHGVIDELSNKAPTMIFLPGISGKALTDRFDYLRDGCVHSGFNFFRFNCRGYEEGASIDDSTVESELEDIRAAIDFLTAGGYKMDQFGVIAKSFGGLKAFMLDDPRLAALGLLAPAIFFDQESNYDEMKGRPYSQIEHLSEIKVSPAVLESWNVPTVLVQGDADTVVPVSNSQFIYDSLSSPKELMVMSGADHSLGREEDKKMTLDIMMPFLREHLSKS
jgi:pimeloyl-ACP methyl ester carboxylesterase